MEGKEKPHSETQHHLTKDFEASGHASLVFLEDFYVIIDKADNAQPHGGNEHGDDIYVVQLGKEKRGDDNGGKDEQTAHGGSALFLFLAFESEVADRLANGTATDKTDERLAAEKHDEQGENGRHGSTE